MVRVVVLSGLLACSFRPAAPANNQEAGTGGELTPIDAPRDGAGDSRPGDAKVFKDAPAPVCDPTACSGAGGTCNASGVCVIHVTAAGAVGCPTGEACQIECDNQNTCQSGIDCATAASCEIDCNNQNTCQAETVDCTGPGCTFYCRDQNTCQNQTLHCGNNAQACHLECCASNTCTGDTLNTMGSITIQSPGTCP